MKRPIRAIIASASGNLVEWYDFYVYSFCALYFAAEFFPQGDRTTQLLNAAGVFAAGFLTRPLGSWFFGRLADRKGRKTSMLASILLMCFGSLLVALLPTYKHIGVWAPALLVLARMLQGVSVGGEYGISAAYMSEVASSGRRGFLASFQQMTLIGGQLLALLVLLVLQSVLSREEISAWGWRIPFLIGAAAALVALYLRRSMHETISEEQRAAPQTGTLRELMQYKRALITVFGFTAGGTLCFYTYTTYMQKYLVNTAGLSTEVATRIMTGALIYYMLVQPLFGALSDRIGRRGSMMAFGALATCCTIPLLSALGTASNPFVTLVLVMSSLTIVSFYSSISGLIKAKLFPMRIRALGVGLSYAIANAMFGGSAEAVALWFKKSGMESTFFWYVSSLTAIVFLTALLMPHPKKNQGEGIAEDLRS